MTWYVNLSVFGRPGSWKAFLDRRNDLAHKYFSPPREWAKDACEFVRANVEDLWPGEVSRHNTRVMPWSELCRLVKLHEHLPPNLIKDSTTNEGERL